jgi:outer membrane protein TolC
MSKKIFLFLFFFIIKINFGLAQNAFTPEVFWQNVSQNHPLVARANLLTKRSAAQQRIAFGGFDPLIYTYYNTKNFKDKNYYTLLESGVKIPTIIGAEVKVNYEINGGSFLNPEAATPQRGLATVGVTMPLLQGLLFDERRAALQQATIFAKANEQEQRVLLNNFAYDALSAYWNWTLAAERLRITKNALALTKTRYRDTRITIQQGDRAAIDSIEARLAVLQMEAQATESEGGLYSSTQIMRNFLLDTTKNTPLSADFLSNLTYSPKRFTPDLLADSLQVWQNRLLQTHPELQAYQLKIADLGVERRLKQEKIKPKLNVTYNFLAEEWNFTDPKYGTAFDNTKFGVSLSYPILTRTDRGNLQLTDLKIQDSELMMQQKRIELLNKTAVYYNEWRYNWQQIQIFEQYVADYETLCRAERTRFANGESSLFLINSREQKLVEGQLKLMELNIKHFKYLMAIQWAIGELD